MPCRLSNYVCQRIIRFKTDGKVMDEIVGILGEKDGTTKVESVRRWIQRWEAGKGLQDFSRSGRCPMRFVHFSFASRLKPLHGN